MFYQHAPRVSNSVLCFTVVVTKVRRSLDSGPHGFSERVEQLCQEAFVWSDDPSCAGSKSVLHRGKVRHSQVGIQIRRS